MSSQKRKASHPDIKQYFCTVVQKKQTSVAVAVKIIFQQEEQHSTVSEVNHPKKSIQFSVSANGQSEKSI